MQIVIKNLQQNSLMLELKQLNICFQCGTCGGSCPSGRRTPYKVKTNSKEMFTWIKRRSNFDDAFYGCVLPVTLVKKDVLEVLKSLKSLKST